MIAGLYEAHLPVKELERSIVFYEKLGLACAFRNERVAFFWIEHGKSWLGLWKADQPLVLDNHPHAHAAIYFEDPDGNSLELIAPLRFDMETVNGTMPYQDWQHLFETESEKKTI